uniref:Uncharacterized protein n=1 Tax=Anguilla anguilla TaxID=7936 RepID=A0A0E9PM09_ANGAN
MLQKNQKKIPHLYSLGLKKNNKKNI